MPIPPARLANLNQSQQWQSRPLLIELCRRVIRDRHKAVICLHTSADILELTAVLSDILQIDVVVIHFEITPKERHQVQREFNKELEKAMILLVTRRYGPGCDGKKRDCRPHPSGNPPKGCRRASLGASIKECSRGQSYGPLHCCVRPLAIVIRKLSVIYSKYFKKS